jgi:uncharacterized protein (TIGR02145 family)
MKIKNSISFYQLIILTIILMFNGNCKKDDSATGNQTNGKTKAIFNSSLTYGTMTDQDENTYKTIKIGTQTWMAENLRTTKYRDGESIPEVTDFTSWAKLTTGAYCNYDNTKNIDTIATFGRLYNWHTLSDIRNIAPSGWHVASDIEWTILTTYLSGAIGAGGKLKETSTTHWKSPNTGTTNETGFTALPGGLVYSSGTFGNIGNYGDWWCSTENNTTNAYCRSMGYDFIDVYICGSNKNAGFSVRCVKD